jgi:hypothetical protein
MSSRFLFVCIAAVLLGSGCSADEPAPTSAPPAAPVEPAPVAAAEPEVDPAPAEADVPEEDGSAAPGEVESGDPGPSEDDSQPGDDKVAVPPSVKEGGVAPIADPVVEKYVDPDGGGSIEPVDDPVVSDGAGHPSTDNALSGVATLLGGARFRWIQGSKDVASGFYGIPVLLNVWSCSDKNFEGAASWLRGLESKYSDHMVSVLLAANESERNFTDQDSICDLKSRPVRSHGIDLDGVVFKKLGAKRSPAVYVYNENGELVASHVGPISAGSAGARKIEAAFRPLMAPVLELRRTSAKP